MTRLAQEPQIAARKIHQVRENGRQAPRADSKPRCQRRRILIQRRRGDPPAILVGVVRAAERQSWKRSIDRIAFHCASQNQLVGAPGVVRAAIGARFQRAAEFRKRERRHLVGNSQLLRGLIERRHACADVREQRHLLRQLVGMRVKSAGSAEEDLALYPQGASRGNHLGHLLHLLSEITAREMRLQRRDTLAAQPRAPARTSPLVP